MEKCKRIKVCLSVGGQSKRRANKGGCEVKRRSEQTADYARVMKGW